MRKGQIEMIGLVIVVIILVVGLLFYLRFGVLRKDDVKKDVMIEYATSVNLMRSLFNVKICDDGSLQVQEAMIKCLEEVRICGDKEACSFVNKTIRDILGSTNLNKTKKYTINISQGDNEKSIINDCKTGILVPGTIQISSDESFTTEFVVCDI
jgi:hypothetical protein